MRAVVGAEAAELTGRVVRSFAADQRFDPIVDVRVNPLVTIKMWAQSGLDADDNPTYDWETVASGEAISWVDSIDVATGIVAGSRGGAGGSPQMQRDVATFTLGRTATDKDYFGGGVVIVEDFGVFHVDDWEMHPTCINFVASRVRNAGTFV